jgi:hypothetical protein
MTTKPPAIALPDVQLVNQLLAATLLQSSIGERIKTISGELMGRPYLVNPLIGSTDQPEVLVTTLSGFDCVTFVESVLAMAYAHRAEDYAEWLREIRYLHGEITWNKRHHYTTDWMRHNIHAGFLSEFVRSSTTSVCTKELNIITGLPERIVSFRYYPKSKLKSLSSFFQDGDIIAFVSTKKGLDVFHVGLLVRDGDQVLMRHAARSRGAVVEQPLAEFVEQNRTPGFVIVRPRERQ